MFTVALGDLGAADLPRAGGKGANLGELVRAGLPVPPGFVLTTAAYDAATAGVPHDDPAATRALVEKADVPAAVRDELLAAYAALGGGPVAVRSSATAEDLPGASFAGQQDTYLDVRGPDALLDAVRRCWASLWTDRAVAYRRHQGVDQDSVSLAVVVQTMVDADAAGVLFTADPATGRRDRIVVSAAWGLGESVVGGTVSTDDLVLDRDGLVCSRRTADKAVMTVATGGGTAEVPVPADRRDHPVLDDAAAAALARLGVRVQEHFGSPQDVEWARAGDTFWLVQARPITALPEPEVAPPTEWPIPDPTGMYVRASIVEQLPNPLSPLFADLVDPAVGRSLRALFADGLGRDVLRDGDVGLPTINGYAYYHYTRAAMLQMVAATPRALPLMRGAVRRWREVAHPRYASAVDRRAGRDLATLPATELLDGAAELVEAGCVYYTSVQTIIPVAATTEVAFTRYYEALVRRAGDPPAATLLLGFDSTPIRAEKSLHDLATWTAARPELAAALRAGDVPDDPSWRARFQDHLDRYGHTVYNLDVAEPVPADDPGPLLDTLRYFLDGTAAGGAAAGGAGGRGGVAGGPGDSGAGGAAGGAAVGAVGGSAWGTGDPAGGRVDPYERQRRAAARREEAAAAVRARLDPLRRRTFDRLLAAAQTAAPVREDALADVGLGWPLIRRMLHELGRRLAAAGVIGAPEDVHWLRLAELRSLARAWDGGARAVPVAPGRAAVPREVAAGAVPGEVAAGAVPGEVAAGAVPGEVAAGAVPGEVAAGAVPGEVAAGAVPGEVAAGEVAAAPVAAATSGGAMSVPAAVDTVPDAVDAPVTLVDHTADVAARRAEWRGRRRVTPPQMLPRSTWLRVFDRVMPAASGAQDGPVLRGVAASGGRVTGPARVLAGPADFARFEPGDVLVATITTPAWTPLFARAAAVVTDVGGPLSHGSIVAREYAIPAVLGTAVATRRIADGARVRVDGDAGTVTLLDDPGAPAAGPGAPAAASGGAAPGGARTAAGGTRTAAGGRRTVPGGARTSPDGGGAAPQDGRIAPRGGRAVPLAVPAARPAARAAVAAGVAAAVAVGVAVGVRALVAAARRR